MTYNFLDTSVEFIKGVGPQRATLLRTELNIYNYGELLNYYPFRYVDRSKFQKVSDIVSDNVYVQIKGRIRKIQLIGKHRTSRMTAILEDDTAGIELVWFNGIKWLKNKIKENEEYIVFGKPSVFNNKFNITHPEVESVSEALLTMPTGLQPFYSSTEKLKTRGLDSRGISKIMKNLVMQIPNAIPENLSKQIIDNLKMISHEEALINIHFPQNQHLLDRAIARLKFEELFFIQLRLLKLKIIRNQNVKGHVFSHVGSNFNDFYNKNLPFELTNAQKKVTKEIRVDIGSGRQMNRLLQGDVGSGKTLVALMVCLIGIDNNFQACIMAPTEILANQHFKTITKFLHGLDIKTELLTGSTKTKQRKLIHQQLESGELQILVGTHALIEDAVQFKNLGIVVIDEQHRFGVAQRARLWKKNTIPPHILVMTATPIPRTLAMTFYGDLDLSVIDELPPGRKPIKTLHYYDEKRLRLFAFMKEQIKSGRQIYVVYPLINESETLDLKHLMDGYESIVREFPLPEYAISIVHGQMKGVDRDYEMQRFVKGETQIMVATTVIEVGVDIPNASIMIIESAQRFGLSQLHQLRGRVGRGGEQSYCILMTDYKLSSEAKQRIQTMVRTNNGFDIAEMDLKLRGPGDLQGTQQSGVLDLKLTNLAHDEKIIAFARKTASDLLDDDPEIAKDFNRPILEHLKYVFKAKTDWSLIS